MRKLLIPFIVAFITLYLTAGREKEDYADCALCLLMSSKGTVSINESGFYPMHSIVKFPQALQFVAVFVTHPTSPTELAEIVKISLD